MDEKTFYVRAEIDAKAFWDFAVFDNFRLRRVWRSPLLFAAILTASACVCFALQSRAEQAIFLGTILLLIGLGLPCFYFLNFFFSVRTQIKRMKLDKQPRNAYTLTFCKAQGVSITAGAQRQTLAWHEVFGAYRVPGYLYVYAAANRAYLLADSQVDGGADNLWALLQHCVTPTAPDRVREFFR